MTPQILLNGLRHSFFKLDLIKVMIVDECHHTRGKHPYASIMTVSYLSLLCFPPLIIFLFFCLLMIYFWFMETTVDVISQGEVLFFFFLRNQPCSIRLSSSVCLSIWWNKLFFHVKFLNKIFFHVNFELNFFN